jgi:hypothetical protein
MRILPLTAAAITLALAGAALAQERPPVATTGDYARTSATMPASYWNGSADAWNAHADACSARYRTYNAATDMYFSRPGVARRCTLALSIGPAEGSPSEFSLAQPPGVGAPLPPAAHNLGNESGSIIGAQADHP